MALATAAAVLSEFGARACGGSGGVFGAPAPALDDADVDGAAKVEGARFLLPRVPDVSRRCDSLGTGAAGGDPRRRR